MKKLKDNYKEKINIVSDLNMKIKVEQIIKKIFNEEVGNSQNKPLCAIRGYLGIKGKNIKDKNVDEWCYANVIRGDVNFISFDKRHTKKVNDLNLDDYDTLILFAAYKDFFPYLLFEEPLISLEAIKNSAKDALEKNLDLYFINGVPNYDAFVWTKYEKK